LRYVKIRGYAVRLPEDITARARIRDAALEQFAERGVAGATIRGIAGAAGVSPGLVQHHFGSKEDLRAACDDYAFATIRRMNTDAPAGGGIGDAGLTQAVTRVALPIQRYLARSLTEGVAGAATLFDELVALTRERLAQGAPGMRPARTDDIDGYAAVLTGMSLGVLVLRGHLARRLGADPLTPDGHLRYAAALLDIFTDSLITPELEQQARAGLAELGVREQS
jgi:AcrR family transcriptional regulator